MFASFKHKSLNIVLAVWTLDVCLELTFPLWGVLTVMESMGDGDAMGFIGMWFIVFESGLGS